MDLVTRVTDFGQALLSQGLTRKMTKQWTDVTLSAKSFGVRQEMYEWCQEQFGPGRDWFDDQSEWQPRWRRLVYDDESVTFFFRDSADAIVFALRWQ